MGRWLTALTRGRVRGARGRWFAWCWRGFSAARGGWFAWCWRGFSAARGRWAERSGGLLARGCGFRVARDSGRPGGKSERATFLGGWFGVLGWVFRWALRWPKGGGSWFARERCHAGAPKKKNALVPLGGESSDLTRGRGEKVTLVQICVIGRAAWCIFGERGFARSGFLLLVFAPNCDG